MTARPRPSLRFFYAASLRARLEKLLAAIEHDESPRRHAEALASVVGELADAGLEYYFVKPLRDAKVGFVALQTASLGMAGALRVMSPMFRSVLANANDTQLRAIGRHVREMMA
jgi:hypothetical protein